MDLGESLRRRRSGGRAREESDRGRRQSGPVRRPSDAPPVLIGLGVLVVGALLGYVVATRVVFPAEAAEATDFHQVPDLRGTSVAEARRLLEGQDLRLGDVDSIRHPEVPEGRVLGQTPLPGQLALPAGVVDLTMSLGPELRPIPDVRGLRADRALTVLRTTGFEVHVDSIEADEPAGRVIGMQPTAGTEVALPAEVRVAVSLGPPLVVLPDLVGMQEEEARATLTSLGLVVGEVESRFRFGFNQGEVLEQFPAAEAEIPRGGAVRLVVGRQGVLRDGGGAREGGP